MTYPYGEIYYTFYYGKKPKSLVCIQKTKVDGEIVDRTLYTSEITNSMWKSSNPSYWPWATGYEITITAPDDSACWITEMEMYNTRVGGMSVVSKMSEQTLYFPLTAPKFIGNLQGTADYAVMANKDMNGLVIADNYLKKANLNATDDEITARTSKTTAITPYNINNAVKAALTDSSAISGLTDDEKQTARNIFGAISSSDIPKDTITVGYGNYDYNVGSALDNVGHAILYSDTFNFETVLQNNVGKTILLHKNYDDYAYCKQNGTFTIPAGTHLVGVPDTSGNNPTIYMGIEVTGETLSQYTNKFIIEEGCIIENINIVQYTYDESVIKDNCKFINCAFNDKLGRYSIQTIYINVEFAHSGDYEQVIFDNCKFDCFGINIDVANDQKFNKIKIENCEFYQSLAEKSAINVCETLSSVDKNSDLHLSVLNCLFDYSTGNSTTSPISFSKPSGTNYVTAYNNIAENCTDVFCDISEIVVEEVSLILNEFNNVTNQPLNEMIYSSDYSINETTEETTINRFDSKYPAKFYDIEIAPDGDLISDEELTAYNKAKFIIFRKSGYKRRAYIINFNSFRQFS